MKDDMKLDCQNVKELSKASKARDIKRRFALLKNPVVAIFFSIMVIYAITLIVPFVWMLISTFKDRLEFRLNRFGFPDSPTLENYMNVFQKMYVTKLVVGAGIRKIYVPELMFNGLVYAIGNVIWPMFINVITTYACARFDTKIGRFVHSLVIVLMLIPIIGSLGASLEVYRFVGAYDNYFGVLLAHGSFGGSNFLILYGAFKGIPNDYQEAAELDGASHLTIMFRIMVPMVQSTLMAFAILGFISSWNDYQTPLVYLPSMPTIAYGLFQFRFSSDSLVAAIPMQMTGAVIVVIPMVILFLIFKDKMMANLRLGGLKG